MATVGGGQPELVAITFYLTYALLLTTGTITFIEAISTTSAEVRHIMNLETCVSIIAAFFYSQFLAKIKAASDAGKKLDWTGIERTRYLDWFITTPLMLLVLMLVLAYNNNRQRVRMSVFLCIVILNWAMLTAGYLGETKVISRNAAYVIGFVFLLGILLIIWNVYVSGSGKGTRYDNVIIFSIFALIWSMYGVLYLAEKEIKNVGYNILDLFAKCLVGIFFWMYLTKILVL